MSRVAEWSALVALSLSSVPVARAHGSGGVSDHDRIAVTIAVLGAWLALASAVSAWNDGSSPRRWGVGFVAGLLLAVAGLGLFWRILPVPF